VSKSKKEEKKRNEEDNPISQNINLFVKNQDIYNEIFERIDCVPLFDEDETIDPESKFKLYRNKYKYLVEKILCRNINDFKVNGDNYIPAEEAYIVGALIADAVFDDKDDVIVKWFNNRVDLSDCEKSIELYNKIKETLDEQLEFGLITEVTRNEWLRVMGVSTNYNTAITILEIQKQLTKFQNSSLALNQDIRSGEVIYNDANNIKRYLNKPEEKKIDIHGKTVEEIISTIHSQKDYLYIIKEFIKLLEEDAERKGIERIKQYAKNKVNCNLKKADQVEGDERFFSLASEYDVWFRKVYEYLSNNENILKQIEEETNCTDLLDFFKI